MPTPRFSTAVSVLAPALLVACFQGPTPESPIRVEGEPTIEALDGAGETRRNDSIPLRPEFRITLPGGLDAPESSVFLFAGPPEEEWLEDLSRSPARVSTVESAIPLHFVHGETHISAYPISPLERGAIYSLAVAAWALVDRSEPLAVEFNTSEDHSDGANLVDSWPAKWAHGVSPNPPYFGLLFDGPVSGFEDGVFLLGEDGSEVRSEVVRRPCPELGWDVGFCLALLPRRPLLPRSMYRVYVDDTVVDGAGARVGPLDVPFRTALAEEEPGLTSLPLPCFLDETTLPVEGVQSTSGTIAMCVVRQDHSLTLRARLGEAVIARWETSAGSARTVSHQGELELRVNNLEPDRLYTTLLTVIKSSGESHVMEIGVSTVPSLATVAISEVRPDPIGAESLFEYVELWNYGMEPVELFGFALSDSPTRAGDELPEVVLRPMERALVVAQGFETVNDRDVPVPPGVRLLRVDTALGSGGLNNGGEPLYLRDAQSRRVSHFAAARVDRPGRCLVAGAPSSDRSTISDRSVVSPRSTECQPGVR